MPPISWELKNGVNKPSSRGKGSHGSMIKYFRIVSRERESGGLNYRKLTPAHKVLGDEPRSVPIILPSDDPEECLSGFRGWFALPYDKPKPDDDQLGRLRCGAPYRADSDDDKMDIFYRSDDGSQVPASAAEKDEDGWYAETKAGDRIDLEKGEAIKASRRVDVKTYNGKLNGHINDFVDPHDFACDPDVCPIWQNGDCDLQSTLFFHFGGDIGHIHGLAAYRATSINAQKTLMTSLDYISKLTDGVLAGIPLTIHLHLEQKGEYPAPIVKITHPPYPDLMAYVEEELNRRRKLYEAKHGKAPEGFEDIRKTGALKNMQSRSAQETRVDPGGEVQETEGTQEIEVPTSVKTRFNQLGYTDAKKKNTIRQFTDDGELNLEEINKFLEQELDRKLNVDDYTEDEDESDEFDF